MKFTKLPDVTEEDHLKECKREYCIQHDWYPKWGGQPKANFPLSDDRLR